MSLRSWAGFVPEKTVVMVRRKSGGASVPVEPEPASPESIHRVSAIRDSLRESLRPGAASSSEAHAPAPVSRGAAPVTLLLLLESEPSADERVLLEKMMTAIKLGQDRFAVEWGEFPEAPASVVIGVGLGSRKADRLAAVRRDRFEIPSLPAIQSDPLVKRAAWETLKKAAERLRSL